jgi:hypothetical protein
MFKKMRQHFSGLLKGSPGERFEQRFLHHQEGRTHSYPKRILFILGGMIITVAGCILWLIPFLPGLGTPIIIIGLSLIAQESLWLSKLMDKFELQVRRMFALFQYWWKNTSIQKKILFLILVLFILALVWLVFYK